jgi:hypothetical protein
LRFACPPTGGSSGSFCPSSCAFSSAASHFEKKAQLIKRIKVFGSAIARLIASPATVLWHARPPFCDSLGADWPANWRVNPRRRGMVAPVYLWASNWTTRRPTGVQNLPFSGWISAT